MFLILAVPGVPKISYTFVRGASDYLYAPPLQVSLGNWVDNPAAPVANFDSQVSTQVQYAALSSSKQKADVGSC